MYIFRGPPPPLFADLPSSKKTSLFFEEPFQGLRGHRDLAHHAGGPAALRGVPDPHLRAPPPPRRHQPSPLRVLGQGGGEEHTQEGEESRPPGI